MNNGNELTIYKNELNTVAFRKFNATEMDLFFAICTKMRDQGLNTVKFQFEDLKALSNYKPTATERFISDIKSTYSKLLNLSYSTRYMDGKQHDIEQRFIIFTDFKIDRTDSSIEISTNPKLEHILNALSGEFTKFELQEFTNLRSSYSKTAFRLLKQFRLTGYWKIHIDDFKALFDVPESYPMTEITRRVFNPIKKELKTIFKELKIAKLKAPKCNKIEYIEFTFKPENDINKKGIKTFRNKKGKYYQNHIENFSLNEFKKSFPEKDT